MAKEKDFNELRKRAEICLSVYRELNNRLFDLNEQYNFTASELTMIVGNLSASMLKAIEKNSFGKEADEKIEQTFFDLVKSVLTSMKASDSEK